MQDPPTQSHTAPALPSPRNTSSHRHTAAQTVGKPYRSDSITKKHSTPAIDDALRNQLKHGEETIAKLKKQNEQLTLALEQERSRLADVSEQLRSEASYSQQVSRLVSVFRELNVNLPALDTEQWDAATIAESVRTMISDNNHDMAPDDVDSDTALECLRLLFGAAEISSSERANSFKFVLRNNVLQREMSFWLSWTDSTFTYTRISMNIPEKDAPEFWPEDSIEFDIRQGPNFLLQVLGSLFHQQS